ncbi:hypothetical protein Dda_6440 [Drechslerella dactyloides]|uniref:Uncharacterized protein n=1 Tax=Drechslerella dactyloides TaxID=74499 RepID=A0AAD6NHE8_DREDA|nr:hypothetical protein Dda_6440 [Drechslerella dactyloides]
MSDPKIPQTDLEALRHKLKAQIRELQAGFEIKEAGFEQKLAELENNFEKKLETLQQNIEALEGVLKSIVMSTPAQQKDITALADEFNSRLDEVKADYQAKFSKAEADYNTKFSVRDEQALKTERQLETVQQQALKTKHQLETVEQQALKTENHILRLRGWDPKNISRDAFVTRNGADLGQRFGLNSFQVMAFFGNASAHRSTSRAAAHFLLQSKNQAGQKIFMREYGQSYEDYILSKKEEPIGGGTVQRSECLGSSDSAKEEPIGGGDVHLDNP